MQYYLFYYQQGSGYLYQKLLLKDVLIFCKFIFSTLVLVRMNNKCNFYFLLVDVITININHFRKYYLIWWWYLSTQRLLKKEAHPNCQELCFALSYTVSCMYPMGIFIQFRGCKWRLDDKLTIWKVEYLNN